MGAGFFQRCCHGGATSNRSKGHEECYQGS